MSDEIEPTLEDWQYEVANGDTVLGFKEYLEHWRESEGVQTSDPGAICPACKQQGGVYAVQDAVVRMYIPHKGEVPWGHPIAPDEVELLDEVEYFCLTCHQELTRQEINESNPELTDL